MGKCSEITGNKTRKNLHFTLTLKTKTFFLQTFDRGIRRPGTVNILTVKRWHNYDR